jgi:hypothetical protein
MNRRNFLALISLIGCTDINKDCMDIKKMWWWNRQGGEPTPSDPFESPEYTNEDNQQAFLLIGDSIARGNSDAPGTEPTSGTVYQWDANTSSVIEVGDNDLLEVAAIKTPNGSPWPRFGIEYNSATGKKPVFICTAIGGASWYRANGSISWFTNGTIYADAVTKANNAISALGVSKVRAVFIVLGYNDSSDDYTLDYSYCTSLIDRINTDFDNPKIYLGVPDRAVIDTAGRNTRLCELRKYGRQLSFDYDNVELSMNLSNLNYWAGNYQTDNIHLNFAGNELLGTLLSRQINLLSTYHKHAKSIMGCTFTDLSTARKTLINNFIESQDLAGNLEIFDNLYLYKNAAIEDAEFDWMFVNNSSLNLITFTANQYATTNGSSNRIVGPNIRVSQNNSNLESDAIYGVRIASNVTGSNVDCRIMGLRNGSTGAPILELAQTAGGQMAYRFCDNTVKIYTGDGSFQDDTLYSLARNGSNRYIFKNKTQDDTSTQASLSLSDTQFSLSIGARTLSGSTIDNYMAAQFLYFFAAKYSTFDLDSFYDEMETLIAGWND